MKKAMMMFLVLAFVIFAAQGCNSSTAPVQTEDDAYKVATEVYAYGYPLVLTEVTRGVMTNVPSPDEMGAPANQFVHMRDFPNADFKMIICPNVNTLSSSAWLDLTQGPVVLRIPDTKGHYYLLPMLDAWTNVFDTLGAKTNGFKEQDIVIVGPLYFGHIPAGHTVIKSPTNTVWIIGRIYCSGTPEDLDAVHKIQDQFTLIPWSEYGKPYTPAKGTVDASIDMKTSPVDQVNNMDAGTFFKTMAWWMAYNPPTKADAVMVNKMWRLGIMTGQPFDISKCDPAVAKGLERAVKDGQAQIKAAGEKSGKPVNGWTVDMKLGIYGADYAVEHTSRRQEGWARTCRKTSFIIVCFLTAREKP